MHDDGERVNRLTGDQDIELDHGRFPIVGKMVVERGVAARDGLEAIVEVENNFIQRQLVVQHDAIRGDVLKSLLAATFLFDQGQYPANVFRLGQDGGQNHRFLDLGNLAGVGPAGGIIDFDHLTIGLVYLVADAGSGGDQRKVELALQTLLNDLHVEQAEKSAAKAEAQGDGAFRLEEE